MILNIFIGAITSKHPRCLVFIEMLVVTKLIAGIGLQIYNAVVLVLTAPHQQVLNIVKIPIKRGKLYPKSKVRPGLNVTRRTRQAVKVSRCFTSSMHL